MTEEQRAAHDAAWGRMLDVLRPLTQDDETAVGVYASLCNVIWVPTDHPAQTYGEVNVRDYTALTTTWRYAGGLVADLREKGEDYMHFYCSGGEGQPTPEVIEAMASIGYRPVV